jgi:hypothetical protein
MRWTKIRVGDVIMSGSNDATLATTTRTASAWVPHL